MVLTKRIVAGELKCCNYKNKKKSMKVSQSKRSIPTCSTFCCREYLLLLPSAPTDYSITCLGTIWGYLNLVFCKVPHSPSTHTTNSPRRIFYYPKHSEMVTLFLFTCKRFSVLAAAKYLIKIIAVI